MMPGKLGQPPFSEQTYGEGQPKTIGEMMIGRINVGKKVVTAIRPVLRLSPNRRRESHLSLGGKKHALVSFIHSIAEKV